MEFQQPPGRGRAQLFTRPVTARITAVPLIQRDSKKHPEIASWCSLHYVKYLPKSRAFGFQLRTTDHQPEFQKFRWDLTAVSWCPNSSTSPSSWRKVIRAKGWRSQAKRAAPVVAGDRCGVEATWWWFEEITGGATEQKKNQGCNQ